MAEAPDTDDPKAALKERLHWFCAVWGAPSDLLATRLLPIAEWRRARTWVRGLEALVVTLVRTLAAALDELPALRRRDALRKRRTERHAPDTDYPDSEHWVGVAFRTRAPRHEVETGAVGGLFGPRPRGGSGLAESAQGTKDLMYDDRAGYRPSRSLALRLEAVIRVAEDPMRFARRLARRETTARGARLKLQKKPSAPLIASLDPPRPFAAPRAGPLGSPLGIWRPPRRRRDAG